LDNDKIVMYRDVGRNPNADASAYYILEFKERGLRKVTTGITGMWPPSVHSDVAF
jgi:hypothetical protein